MRKVIMVGTPVVGLGFALVVAGGFANVFNNTTERYSSLMWLGLAITVAGLIVMAIVASTQDDRKGGK